MQSVAMPPKRPHTSLKNSDDVTESDSNQPAQHALLACVLLPPDLAEQFVSLLRELVEHSDSEVPFNPLSAHPLQPASAWLNHTEAASYLGIGVSTLYRYAETERIECRKLGNRLEYRRSSLDRFKDSLIRPARRQRARAIIPSTLGSGN
jgi:excisionase family DNA binding protein